MTMEAILASIPYLQGHRLELVEAGRGAARLRLDLRPEMTNHVGLLHAGALYTLAETTAGVAVQGAVPEAMILLRDATLRYLRPAHTDVAAVGLVDLEAARQARECFAADGRTDLAATVTVSATSGEELVEATFTYALRSRSR